MELYKGTGVTKTGEIKVSKSIGGLIIASSKTMEQLANETITAWIERANGSNIEIATNIPLNQFILACTYGGESVQSDADYNLIAVCEVAHEGSVRLFENESLKFKLDGLTPGTTYAVNGVENPVDSDSMYKFELKTIASEDPNKKIDVRGYDLAVVNTLTSVDTVSYTFGNKEVVKYTPFELKTLSRDIDPIQVIAVDGTVQQNIGTMVTLPLLAVNDLEFQKSSGTLISITLRTSHEI